MGSSAFFSLLFFFSLLLSATAQRPKALVLPIVKDAATLQYVAQLRQRTPLVPLPSVVHVGGAFLWLDCAAGNASSSTTFRAVPCRSAQCAAAKSTSCVSPNSCGFFPENPFISTVTSGELAADVLSLSSTDGSNPGAAVAASNFIFGCAPEFLLKGLAHGAKGIAGFGRNRVSLPSQLAAQFSFRRRFALCLSSSATGVAFFGGGPYKLLPGIDVSSPLLYTPLLANPVSYSVSVSSIKINGNLVAGVKKTLMEISTVNPYTVVESSIYKAVAAAFAKESGLRRLAVPARKPFGFCFDSRGIGSTRVGPAVPQIDLVLQSELVYWRIFGANSVVEVADGVSCLAFVDGGAAARTGIILGGYQLEDNIVEFDLAASRLGFSSSLRFRQTTCANFNFTSVSA